MVRHEDAIGLRNQIIKVGAPDRDAERAVGVERPLGPLELNMKADISRPPLVEHFNLAIGPIILAIGPLQNEVFAFRQQRLKGALGHLLNRMIGAATGQIFNATHGTPKAAPYYAIPCAKRANRRRTSFAGSRHLG